MIVDLQQNTPEWLAFRSGKIGASDAPIVMGVSPWTTPYQLWERKLKLVPEKEKTFQMQRGHDLEDAALKCFNELMWSSLKPKVVLHKYCEWMMASLDGFDGDKLAVEIKCPGREDHLIALSNRIPDKYFPQLQHQLLCADLQSMWYYSFDGNTGCAVFVPADEQYQNEMLNKELEFYKCMKEFTPPLMTERDYQIKKNPEFMEVVAQYKSVKKNLRQCEDLEKELRGQLVEAVCGQNTITTGLKISRSIRKCGVNYEMIPELDGIDLDQYRGDPILSWRITETKDACYE